MSNAPRNNAMQRTFVNSWSKVFDSWLLCALAQLLKTVSN